MADFKICDSVRGVLERCTITATTIKLPPGQLERRLYERVKKALNHVGGKWTGGKTQAFVFKTDPRAKLGLALESGVVVDEKKKFQFFPTPPELAAQVVELAQVSGHWVLEPSAGHGALVKECLAQGAAGVDCIEINPENYNQLADCRSHYDEEKVSINLGDFLGFDPDRPVSLRSDGPERFDRIVMNPPFTRDQDIQHVEHALKFLKPDGRLVAIMLDNTERKKFGTLLLKIEQAGFLSIAEKVPAGTFKDTDIRTLILSVWPKPGKPKNPFADLVTTSAHLLAAAGGRPVVIAEGDTDAASAGGASVPASRSIKPISPQSTIEHTKHIEPNMKLTIARTHLAAALAAVRNAAVARPDATNAILGNVLLSADGKTLTLSTSDLDVALRTTLAADVQIKGQCTVGAALLHDLCKSFKADRITLSTTSDEQDAGKLVVIAGSAKFELATLPPDDFPPVPEVKDEQTFELLEHELASLLRRTSFCRGKDAERVILTGTVIRMDGETFVAACDGQRLAVEQGAPTSIKADILLPGRATAELLRLLGTDAEKPRKVTVTFNAQQAQFTFGEHHLITKLIEGQYPDYTKIVPTLDDAKIVTVDRVALLAAVKRVALISDGVELVFKNKSLHVSSCNASGDRIGKSAESLLTTGTVEATARFAVELLVASLEAVDGEEINLYPATDSPIALHDPTSTWLGVISAMK